MSDPKGKTVITRQHRHLLLVLERGNVVRTAEAPIDAAQLSITMMSSGTPAWIIIARGRAAAG